MDTNLNSVVVPIEAPKQEVVVDVSVDSPIKAGEVLTVTDPNFLTSVDAGIESSTRIGFDPTKVSDPRIDVGDEGGIIAPGRGRDNTAPGSVMLTGIKVSYYIDGSLVSKDVRDYFDNIDDAMATILTPTTYVMNTNRGIKMCKIDAGAPRISVNDRETHIFIQGSWKKS